MKVVLLGATPPPIGGIAAWTVRMLKAKLKNNWSLVLVDEKINTGREMFGEKNRYNLLKELKRWINIWYNLWKALNDKEVKVVHACPTAEIPSLMAEYVSSIITKIRRKKFIVHFRCTVPNMVNGRLNKYILKKLCDSSSAIIALNSQTEEFLRRITSTPVRIIPNFVSVEEECEEHIINETIKRIIYVGGVISTKGCDDIIEVAKECKNIEFRLIGRADQDMANAAKCVDNVVLVGTKSHDGVLNEMKNADVFIFLSRYPGEGFSNALAEAMISGLPCIVSNWAANADMIDNELGGVVVPCSNPMAAIDAVNAISSAKVRREQSKHNYEKAKYEYSERRIIDMYVDYYESIL